MERRRAQCRCSWTTSSLHSLRSLPTFPLARLGSGLVAHLVLLGHLFPGEYLRQSAAKLLLHRACLFELGAARLRRLVRLIFRFNSFQLCAFLHEEGAQLLLLIGRELQSRFRGGNFFLNFGRRLLCGSDPHRRRQNHCERHPQRHIPSLTVSSVFFAAGIARPRRENWTLLLRSPTSRAKSLRLLYCVRSIAAVFQPFARDRLLRHFTWVTAGGVHSPRLTDSFGT